MKLYNLALERAKRNGYKHLQGPVLFEVIIAFLDENPSPILSKDKLKQGIDLFAQAFAKANTVEMRQVASDYLRMYHKQFMTM